VTRRAAAPAPTCLASILPSSCRFASIVVLASVLAACGGGGDGGDGGGGGECSSNPLPGATVTVSGRIAFERVPFSTDVSAGLDYVAITTEPAREVIVEVLSATNQAVLASTMTDANGQYSATVASNTSTFVRAKAQTRHAAPGWDVRVLNNANGNALYVLDSTAFCTDATTVVRNLTAESGWPDFGGTTYSGTRASAPFAILDSIHRAVQFLRANGAAGLDLPALSVFWSPDNRLSDNWNPATGAILSGTQYAGVAIDGFPAGIYVLGQEGVDTDEFDQHVVVHEFQHFLEDAISRTDSPAGPHSINERLDMRLAFAEGYANAFSAMVLDDPIYRDSYGTRQGQAFAIDFESNVYNPAGWFNEGSVQSLVWDLYDTSSDGQDDVSLGFAPMLAALRDELRTGTALVSLYSFVAALEQDPGAPIGGIDTLVESQQVFGTDAFGAGETNFANITEANPVYTDLIVGGGAQRVCGTTEAGTYNTLGNRLFLKFSISSPATVTIRAETLDPQLGDPRPDPDIVLYRGGYLDDAMSSDPDIETLVRPLEAGEYVIEVYEYSHVDLAGDASRRGVTCMKVSVS
jgi:hypothetical protein